MTRSRRKRLYVITAISVCLLLGGVYLGYRARRGNPRPATIQDIERRLARVQEIENRLAAADLADDERRELQQELVKEVNTIPPEKITASLKARISELGAGDDNASEGPRASGSSPSGASPRNAFFPRNLRDEYFNLPPEKRVAYLDKTVDAQEKLRRQLESKPEANGGAPASATKVSVDLGRISQGDMDALPPNSIAIVNGKALSLQDPDNRHQFNKHMKTALSPEYRAMMKQYLEDLAQRRRDRGLEPGFTRRNED